jgi:hypothetical protein
MAAILRDLNRSRGKGDRRNRGAFRNATLIEVEIDAGWLRRAPFEIYGIIVRGIDRGRALRGMIMRMQRRSRGMIVIVRVNVKKRRLQEAPEEGYKA